MSCFCQNFDILLTVAGITGTPDNLENAIRVCYYDQKHLIEPNGGGGQVTRAEFEDLVVYKNIDQYSPILAASVANGQHYTSAVIYFLDGTTGNVFYKVTLREVTFTYFQQMTVDFDDTGFLVEKIHIHYEDQIEWEWNGTQRCWDISENSAC